MAKIDVKRDSQKSGFNIENFRASIAKHGYLDNNSFEVYVQTPPVFQNGFLNVQGTPVNISEVTKNLAFRIDQVRAPGISIMSSDINRYGVGPTQKMPVTAQYSEVNISILGDHFCEFWQFWYHWTRAVFEYNSARSAGFASYTVGYKEEYTSTVSIVIYDHYGNKVQVINLIEAFPTAIREVPLGWGDPGLMRINVALSYTEYTIEEVGVGSHNQSQPTNLSNGGERNTTTDQVSNVR